MNKQISLDSESVLYKAIYSEKKLSKAQVREFNIDLTIDSLEIQDINLKRAGTIILALTRIFVKRFRYLADDCNHVLQILSKDSSSVQRSIKIPSSKTITLHIEGDKMFIDDDMIEMENEFPVELEDGILSEPLEDHVFETDFGDVSNIEQVRDSTALSSGIFNNESNININVKKRRNIEDAITEMNDTLFRANIRSASDILAGGRGDEIAKRIRAQVYIDPKILQLFKEDAQSVEIQRNTASVASFEGPSFSVDRNDVPDARVQALDSSTFLDISDLPETFVFDIIVKNYSVHIQAEYFYQLLAAASGGKIDAVQDEPFGEIRCLARR